MKTFRQKENDTKLEIWIYTQEGRILEMTTWVNTEALFKLKIYI